MVGDGSDGYPPEAPYDGILVAAAAPEIPSPLLDQLAVGGRLVLPLGRPRSTQMLVRVRRGEHDLARPERLMACAFVPLLGHYGWSEASE